MEGQEMPDSISDAPGGSQHTVKALKSPAEKKADFALFPKDT